MESLESELKQTKQTYSTALIKLIKRVKKLEHTIRTSQARRRATVMIFDAKEDVEDPSKQGKIIEDVDKDTNITLVTRTKVSSQSDQSEDHLKVLSAAKVLADAARKRREVANVTPYTRRKRIISIAEEPVNTAGVSKLVSTADMVQERIKDKGKAIMQESEQPKKIKKKEYQQISLDEEIAQNLYAEELAKDTTRQEHERYNLEKALELQKQLDEREEVVAEATHAHDIDLSDPDVLRYHAF
ncbi:hypothetical protein Tco_0726513 [Tanacetum coccineum]|uniref:Uncharacterized protein n=1 Tax=Tanacetum coccineum TaxID=301880 RepID=A0ABQ4YIA9_9ASTR